MCPSRKRLEILQQCKNPPILSEFKPPILNSSKFSDFIVGQDDSTLAVNNAGFGDLNSGGITSGVESNGVRGCTGKAITEPEFKKGDIE